MATPTLGSRCANRGSGLTQKLWFEWFPRISVEVECSGSNHQVAWHRGELTLLDHDIEAEKTLAALGGEPAYCFSLYEAWKSAEEDNSLDTEILLNEEVDWASSSEFKLTHLRKVLQTFQASASSGLTSGQIQVPAGLVSLSQSASLLGKTIQEKYERELMRHILFAAPYELRRMLGFQRVFQLGSRWETDSAFRREYGPLLEGVLTRRVLPALQRNVTSWNPRMSPHAITTFECWPAKAHEEPSMAGTISADGGFALVNLAFSWLFDVWYRDIALIDDCFVLEATPKEANDSELRLLAARWERVSGRSVPVVSPATGFCGSDGVFHLSWGS